MPNETKSDNGCKEIFNKEKFFNRFDEAFARKIITQALKSMPEYYENLQNSYEEMEYKDLRRAAHTLKGLADNINANALAKTALIIEKAAYNQNNDKIEDGFSDIHEVYQKTFDTFQELKESLE